MDESAAEDQGRVYYAEVREALPAEAAPLLARDEADRQCAERAARIRTEIVHPAQRPPAEVPDLEGLPEVKVGPLEHLRVDRDGGWLWVLTYNGADGDDWSASNYHTYVARRVTLTAEIDLLIGGRS